MRKALFVILMLAAVVGAVGSPVPQAEASTCFYTCRCPGVPYKCCTSSSGTTSCKPANPSPIECPQIIDC